VDQSFSEELLPYKNFSCDSAGKFYYNVGRGTISLNSVRMAVSTGKSPKSFIEDTVCLMDFTPGIVVHFAECCHPILGDKIIGVFVPQKGLIIHSTSCDHISREKNSLIMVKWNKDDEVGAAFITKLRIVILNKLESFAIITNIICSNGASITNIKVEHRSVDFFDLLVDIKVKDVIHLGEVQAALRVCSNVRSVRRL
jgi:GTP pyrophosphokinase